MSLLIRKKVLVCAASFSRTLSVFPTTSNAIRCRSLSLLSRPSIQIKSVVSATAIKRLPRQVAMSSPLSTKTTPPPVDPHI
ncbi:hypothetical protein BDEG_24873 [Batrachochytrium dendrobatidis JEL423]|uniref:Uncharacterized protein n=1 Tax=Batrachochytrium dendrobatidis (strain JEL423) TaxID=403673 RepID=A0A177WPF6_BATDL|nr:hypothetical protein BDEG_24873 [Batrachochytrium dendrobatidis JEL423]